MADVTITIGSGGDRPTVALAIARAQDTAYYDRTAAGRNEDICHLKIIDNAEYNESNLVFSGFGGEASTSSKYVHFYTDPTYWCNGDDPWEGTVATHTSSIGAGIRGNTANEHVVHLEEDYLHLENIAVFQGYEGNSLEAVNMRAANVTNVVLERCFLRTRDHYQEDGFYVYSATTSSVQSAELYRCVIVGGGSSARSCVNIQMLQNGPAATVKIGHCTLDGNNIHGGSQTGNVTSRTSTAGGETTVDINNSLVWDCQNYVFDDDNKNGTQNWYGVGNIIDDLGITTPVTWDTSDKANNEEEADFGIVGGAAVDVRFETELDLRIVEDGGTELAIAGALADGVTWDERIDPLLDIAGNVVSSTVTERDVGAYQISTPAGGGSSPPPPRTRRVPFQVMLAR